MPLLPPLPLPVPVPVSCAAATARPSCSDTELPDGPRAELASERCAEECKRTAKGVKPEDMDSQEHIVAWINSLFGRLQTAAESVEEEAPPRVGECACRGMVAMR